MKKTTKKKPARKTTRVAKKRKPKSLAHALEAMMARIQSLENSNAQINTMHAKFNVLTDRVASHESLIDAYRVNNGKERLEKLEAVVADLHATTNTHLEVSTIIGERIDIVNVSMADIRADLMSKIKALAETVGEELRALRDDGK